MRGPARAAGRPPGFVLVGVVMFVLALTIVLLSLYGLSSYEAQFFQRSLDEERAFQTAMGAIERTKLVLTLPAVTLASAGQSLPTDVTYAVAMQYRPASQTWDSTGNVLWNRDTVLVRVSARSGNASRTAEAKFQPFQTRGYYNQLVTTGGGITVRSTNGDGQPCAQTVQLTGTIWETSGQDTSTWRSLLLAPYPEPELLQPPVPVPDAATYFAQHPVQAAAYPTYTPPAPPVGQIFRLNGISGMVTYFVADPNWSDPYLSHAGSPFSLYDSYNGVGGVTIEVWGPVVWMFPKGVRFDGGVHVLGQTSDACLVIVAGPNGGPPSSPPYDNPEAGIWFFGGLEVLNAPYAPPVVFASSGQVLMEHNNNPVGTTVASDLAIFAGSVVFTGPVTGSGGVMSLAHFPAGALDASLVDWLSDMGALPNATASQGKQLTLFPGTWREIAP